MAEQVQVRYYHIFLEGFVGCPVDPHACLEIPSVTESVIINV